MSAIRCPLYEASLISRHEPAIVSGDQVMLYHELDEFATRAAMNLEEAGVAPGERIALFLPNGWQYAALIFGLLRRRAVACPINTRLPREAVLDQLRRIGCSRIIAKVSVPGDPGLAGFDVLDPDDLLIYREGVGGDHDWHLALEDPATIVFTSGSSGQPKAALLGYGNHYYSARGANANIRLGSRDCWLLSLPLYHVGGLGVLFRCVLAGATMAIPEGDESIERAQERYGVTHLSVVATQLHRLLHSADVPATFSSLKAILLGGSAVSPALLAESQRRHWPVYMSYGLTETASQVCTMSPASPPAKRMTSGLPLRHREVRINAGGEIEVRGPILFQGYVEGAQVERPFDAGGWFATGDLGSLDAEGYLTVQGRKDNMFVSGGENIQPEEIERLLTSMREVEEAVVVSVPHEEFGERPVAFVRWAGDAVPDDIVGERLARVLPAFKIPDAFLAWPAQSPGMKSSRAALQALARKDSARA